MINTTSAANLNLIGVNTTRTSDSNSPKSKQKFYDVITPLKMGDVLLLSKFVYPRLTGFVTTVAANVMNRKMKGKAILVSARRRANNFEGHQTRYLSRGSRLSNHFIHKVFSFSLVRS